MAGRSAEPVRARWAQIPELVPTERNVEESYLFAGGANSENEIREYVVDVILEDGRKAKRRFKYTPSKEYGDTTDFDRDVYRAIILHAFQNGGIPLDGVVYFSLYQLRKILDLPEKGSSYRKIRESIVKLQTMAVNADTYWQELKGFKSEYYSTFTRVNFEANEDRFGRASEHHWVRFDEVIVRSYHEGYVRDLDHNFYFSLNKKHSRALYSEIDLGRNKGLVWEISLSGLAARLGMAAGYRTPSSKKRALAAAHEEMKRKGFLASVSFPDKHTARYEVAEDFVMARTFRERRWTPEEEATIRALIRNNVRAGGARELVASKGTVLCNYYLRALPYQKWVRDPGAWLYKYISAEKPLDVEPPQRFLEEADVVPEYGDLSPAAGGPHGSTRDAPASDVLPPDAGNENLRERLVVWKPDARTVGAAEDLWRRVLRDVGEAIDPSSLRVWFEACRAVRLAERQLIVAVPNTFAKEYIESRFSVVLEEAITGRLGKAASLELVVGERRDEATGRFA
jgi:Replication initiator protein A/DnaA N-terminal domain